MLAVVIFITRTTSSFIKKMCGSAKESRVLLVFVIQGGPSGIASIYYVKSTNKRDLKICLATKVGRVYLK